MLVGVIAPDGSAASRNGEASAFCALHRLLPLRSLDSRSVSGPGTLFFSGDPFQYIHNWVFWFKMLFIVLAGLNVFCSM